jgi:hypothetical protein
MGEESTAAKWICESWWRNFGVLSCFRDFLFPVWRVSSRDRLRDPDDGVGITTCGVELCTLDDPGSGLRCFFRTDSMLVVGKNLESSWLSANSTGCRCTLTSSLSRLSGKKGSWRSASGRRRRRASLTRSGYSRVCLDKPKVEFQTRIAWLAVDLCLLSKPEQINDVKSARIFEGS